MADRAVKPAHKHVYEIEDPSLVHNMAAQNGGKDVNVHNVVKRCECGMAYCSLCEKEFRTL